MFIKLVLVACLAASTLADVSHVVGGYRRTSFGARPFPAAPVPVVRQASYNSGPQIAILRQDSNISPEGSYSFAYETANGIAAQERGDIRPTGPESANKNVQGSFSFTSPEGIPINVQYIADDNGFQAIGDSIPTPPPIPIEIQRSLEYNAAHPEEDNEGSYNARQRYY